MQFIIITQPGYYRFDIAVFVILVVNALCLNAFLKTFTGTKITTLCKTGIEYFHVDNVDAMFMTTAAAAAL